MNHQPTAEAPDGTTIAWSAVGEGDAPPVVLVHGMSESARSFDPLVAPLAETHRVITLDLRGHGESASAKSYDLASFASDVAAVCAAAQAPAPDLVGHSLGGIVVTAAAPLIGARSVVNIDQSLRLAAFKALLDPVADQLRDPATFDEVMSQLFTALAGPALAPNESARLEDLRRPDQEVVLGVWTLVMDSELEELDALVEAALAPYGDLSIPYLSLSGGDEDEGYARWLRDQIPGAISEVWAGSGHYPHLVDTDRFLTTVREFWSTS